MTAAHPESREIVGLVADLGGTNARFALVDPRGRLHARQVYAAAAFTSVEQALASYLREAPVSSPPAAAVLAIAGRVTEGQARFTNLPWEADEAGLREAFGFESVELINDFVAQALALARLSSDDLRPLGPLIRLKPGVVALIGPGTGLGMAALVPGPAGDIAMASEGGHASFAPADEVQLRLWERLRARHGRVSIERVLSGPGLVSIYEEICRLQGEPPQAAHAAQVVAAAKDGRPEAAAALTRFVTLFGAVAGDVALTFGAFGGVCLSGGVTASIVDWLDGAAFRSAFEDKGRMKPYLVETPTLLVMHPDPGLVGAAARLSQIRANAEPASRRQGGSIGPHV